ncbi:tRNA-binding protein [Olleya aquimaris]|uniref:tRNA-binding protein n=1 Tax=Olleya aquimaris TaxID=639310 RepID=A0A327RMZ2_9FLAO|nr:tRNA-binding protein [Olleya aquimaris]RAJ16954.1 tRNA-binding protein [Olleya aquimaris]
MSHTIQFDDFTKVDLRVGTIVEVNDFPKAKNPAYQLTIDFGDLGIKKSSAQITTLYTKEDLLNKQIVAVVNFPKKQIATFMSECLVLGAVNNKDVILLNPENKVPNGTVVS